MPVLYTSKDPVDLGPRSARLDNDIAEPPVTGYLRAFLTGVSSGGGALVIGYWNGDTGERAMEFCSCRYRTQAAARERKA
jgi:hypothetical protein